MRYWIVFAVLLSVGMFMSGYDFGRLSRNREVIDLQMENVKLSIELIKSKHGYGQ